MEREENKGKNKRQLFDMGLVKKFEDSNLTEEYESLSGPFKPELLKIGQEVAVLIDDDKQWVVGKITNLTVQGCIWATVPNPKPKSKAKAKAKQYVVCRIGGEERDYVVSYCFVQKKIK